MTLEVHRCERKHIFYLPKKNIENKIIIILSVTIFCMFLEIFGGFLFSSVALLSDGLHMSTHILAYIITIISYYLVRRYSSCNEFTFGTWKIEVLGAYTTGILLLFTSFVVLWEAILKFFQRTHPMYDDALVIATIGLVVNLISVYLLRGHKEDHIVKGVILHLLSDLLTSILAIIALALGKFLGMWYIDPLIGIIGFLIILKWSIDLIKETADILLDRETKNPLIHQLINAIESDGKSKVYDIHLLRVHFNKYACILGLETSEHNLSHYEKILSGFNQIVHATIEIRKKEKI